MAYTMEDIREGNKIFYYLLKHGELKDDNGELFKSYSDNENISELVRELGEASECFVTKYGGVVYLIPKEDNDFLGFSKAELKKRLCKSNAVDKDYYLSQFVILTLLVTFYNSQGVSSKSRDFIKVGEFINIITDRLQDGVERERDGVERGIAFTNILERFEALKSSDKKSSSKTTKEGFINTILDFLDEQGLIYYIKGDDMIKTTKKLDSFMDWNILNKNNYHRVIKALGEEIDE